MIEIFRLMFNDEMVEVEIQACGFDLCFLAELIHEGRTPTLIQLTQPDYLWGDSQDSEKRHLAD